MFITFEGGEGCGKTTQSELLVKSFLKAGQDCIQTREPGGTKQAEAIRNLLLDKSYEWRATTELLLINAARFEHVQEVILPALNDKKVVVCDRFVDSSMAYQGYGRKLGKRVPAIIHNLLLEGVSPNLTIILDMDPEEGVRRAKATGTKNSFEDLNLEFHKRVRLGFQEISNMAPTRCMMINADQTQAQVHADIINAINYRFNLNLTPVAEIKQKDTV